MATQEGPTVLLWDGWPVTANSNGLWNLPVALETSVGNITWGGPQRFFVGGSSVPDCRPAPIDNGKAILLDTFNDGILNRKKNIIYPGPTTPVTALSRFLNYHGVLQNGS
jgi:hypothetical protein